MYDPTVFENLKIAFENQLYDLDTIERKIMIHNRTDQLDLALLSRTFTLTFSLHYQPEVMTEVILHSSLQELADEILEIENTNPGCFLSLRVYKYIEKERQCEPIAALVEAIWEGNVRLKQTISFEFGQKESNYLNTVDINFTTKLTEEHMGEIAEFLESTLEMVEQLVKI